MSGRHVVRFTSPVSWLCSCSTFQRMYGRRAVERAQESADEHAYIHSGSVEYGNVGSPS